MNTLKYRVVVEFEVPANDPGLATEKLEALSQIGKVDTVKASATKAKKAE